MNSFIYRILDKLMDNLFPMLDKEDDVFYGQISVAREVNLLQAISKSYPNR